MKLRKKVVVKLLDGGKIEGILIDTPFGKGSSWQIEVESPSACGGTIVYALGAFEYLYTLEEHDWSPGAVPDGPGRSRLGKVCTQCGKTK